MWASQTFEWSGSHFARLVFSAILVLVWSQTIHSAPDDAQNAPIEGVSRVTYERVAEPSVPDYVQMLRPTGRGQRTYPYPLAFMTATIVFHHQPRGPFQGGGSREEGSFPDDAQADPPSIRTRRFVLDAPFLGPPLMGLGYAPPGVLLVDPHRHEPSPYFNYGFPLAPLFAGLAAAPYVPPVAVPPFGPPLCSPFGGSGGNVGSTCSAFGVTDWFL